ncbi:uncharacterized protein YjiS (DUF1127 family) [Rhodoligotrophos appendicifer]|uniref:DUF1127 domain-containing protein n=1 Tax=Rhodoligotrophos appendicifer TaxID=987056 RepID=UPI001184ABE1|nr:DUF1127 domain-containing protein [Rhodoligotrophos appendicifer]
MTGTQNSTRTSAQRSLRAISKIVVSRIAHVSWLLLCHWPERRQQRLALREMEAHHLVDIGITRREALQESRKPFWR